MTEKKHHREVTEAVYEKGKDDRVMPTDVQRLGIYTLRIMMPPNLVTFAIETPIAVISVEQNLFSNYRIDFVQFALNGSDKVEDAESQFNGRGFMFITKSGPGRIADMPEEFDIGYMLGTRASGDMAIASGIVIPDDLSSISNALESAFV